jgi:hypothetical protein
LARIADSIVICATPISVKDEADGMIWLVLVAVVENQGVLER